MRKTLLVLGGSSDIGSALISSIGEEYDCIWAHYAHSPHGLTRLSQPLGDKFHLIQADFSDEEATKAFVRELMENEVLPTHIVHLSASSFINQRFHRIPYSEFQNGFDVSFRSIVMVLQALIPKMVKNGGAKIVLALSKVIEKPVPAYTCAYVAQKYALLGFMRAIDAEYRSKGIQINAVSPWIVDTRFIREQLRLQAEQMIEQGIMKRFLTADEVAQAIVELFSEQSKERYAQNYVLTDTERSFQ